MSLNTSYIHITIHCIPPTHTQVLISSLRHLLISMLGLCDQHSLQPTFMNNLLVKMLSQNSTNLQQQNLMLLLSVQW